MKSEIIALNDVLDMLRVKIKEPFTCSKLTIKTLEKDVKYGQS